MRYHNFEGKEQKVQYFFETFGDWLHNNIKELQIKNKLIIIYVIHFAE
jgi:hypothetical protein